MPKFCDKDGREMTIPEVEARFIRHLSVILRVPEAQLEVQIVPMPDEGELQQTLYSIRRVDRDLNDAENVKVQAFLHQLGLNTQIMENKGSS